MQKIAYEYGLTTEDHPLWIWTVASLSVLCAYAGIISYFMIDRQVTILEDESAPIMVELSDVPRAPTSEPQDAPPGVESEDSVAAEAAVRKRVEAVDAEKIVVDESPTKPPPDLAFNVQKEVVPEKKEEPKVETDSNYDQQASAASVKQAAASLVVDAAPGETIAAPTSGSSETIDRLSKSWQNALVAHLNKHKRYPDAAKSARHRGEVYVRFTMNRQGQVLRAQVEKGSGAQALDDEALAMFKRAVPLPVPPPSVRGEEIEFILPVRYRSKQG